MFELPATYKAADTQSNKVQKQYLCLLKLYFTLLVCLGIILLYLKEYIVFKIIYALISIGIIVLSFVFYYIDYQGIWYNARAVAESIKTISWRYAVRVEPFDGEGEGVDTLFIETMSKIVSMNNVFKAHIDATYISGPEISDSMKRIRDMDISQRRDYYHAFRVINQKEWYCNKSKYNKKMSKIFLGSLIVISFFIAIFVFIDIYLSGIGVSDIKFPIEILVSAITIIFTWMQTKKYKELENSYALTAYEIGVISSQNPSKCSGEEILNRYVMNAENAFSREHTQWLARKDS